MVIAALATFAILFAAWLLAPSPGRAEGHNRPVALAGDLATEAT